MSHPNTTAAPSSMTALHPSPGHPDAGACPDCDLAPFARNHYFTGKLLVERDFSDEQRYHVDKLRLHEQRLHGWGVVCGLKVTQHQNPGCRDRFVCVEPGSAVDCCGHDILVPERECIDLTRVDAIRALMRANDTDVHTLQVCLRYRECPTEQIPVLYDECGCDETRCAPNRILESYDIDVLVDPPMPATTPGQPSAGGAAGPGGMTLTKTIPLKYAATDVDVVLHDGSHRLYVLGTGTQSVVYAIDTGTATQVSSRDLGVKAVRVAVSDNGNFLYVAVDPTTGPKEVMVLNAATLATVQRVAVPNSAGAVIGLTPTADPQRPLWTTVDGMDEVLRWGADIHVATGTPAAPLSYDAGHAPRSLVMAPSGLLGYSTARTDKFIHVVDPAAATNTGTLLQVTPSSRLFALGYAGPNELLLFDLPTTFTDAALRLVTVQPPARHGDLVILGPTLLRDVRASADGRLAYILEQDSTTVTSKHLRVLDLDAVRSGQVAAALGPPLALPGRPERVMIAASGSTLYVVNLGVATTDMPSVSVYDISHATTPSEPAEDCAEIWWKHLDGCPGCETADCVVLATIPNWRVGDDVLDQVEPAPTAADDAAAHRARIDNRLGRRLLPGTQTIVEVIDCLMEHGGSGTNGKNGKDGKDGAGLATDLTTIKALGWTHAGTSALTPLTAVGVQGTVPGVAISFSRPVQMASIDAEHVFRVLAVDRTARSYQDGYLCRCAVRGKVFPIKSIVESAPGLIGQAELDLSGPASAAGIAFVFEEVPGQGKYNEIGRRIVAGDLRDLSVELHGDFVVDAVHGNAVAVQFVRGELYNGALFTGTGDLRSKPFPPPADWLGIQGGLFESWFTQPGPVPPPAPAPTPTPPPPPTPVPVPAGGGRVPINRASRAELLALPGVGEALATNLTQARRTKAIRSADDLRRVPGFTDRLVKDLTDRISFD